MRTLVLRLALTLIALVGSATRLHAHHADAVDASQEMNRCLRLVNVATARRQTPTKDRVAAGVSVGAVLLDEPHAAAVRLRATAAA